MKKVGLLTLDPQMYNYGGFLQEMALQDIIIDMGGQCEIINYAPTNELNTFSAKRNLKYLTVSKLSDKLHNLYQRLFIKHTVDDITQVRKAAFDNYRQNLQLSAPISFTDLHRNRLPYDTIVCGSDQIWNPDFNIPAFFLDFAKEDQKTIIYAASLGKSNLSLQQKRVYASLMKEIDYISVREQSAIDILSPLVQQPIELVLDPTLLHDKNYWQSKASLSQKAYSRYVFCYFLDLTKEKVDAARMYAQKTNCKILIIPYLHGHYEFLCEQLADIMDPDVSPADFLKLILDAECILTDSFHATVFSLIFQKNFWVFGRSAGKYDMNTRLDSLLSYYNAKDKMISPASLALQKSTKIIAEDDILKEMKESSLQYLNNAIK